VIDVVWGSQLLVAGAVGGGHVVQGLAAGIDRNLHSARILLRHPARIWIKPTIVI
jgi:hypothetical protein